MTPEKIMKQGFEALFLSSSCFSDAAILYEKRNDDTKADKENYNNVRSAIQLLSKAYDEVSAIWENDIQE